MKVCRPAALGPRRWLRRHRATLDHRVLLNRLVSRGRRVHERRDDNPLPLGAAVLAALPGLWLGKRKPERSKTWGGETDASARRRDPRAARSKPSNKEK